MLKIWMLYRTKLRKIVVSKVVEWSTLGKDVSPLQEMNKYRIFPNKILYFQTKDSPPEIRKFYFQKGTFTVIFKIEYRTREC